MNPPKEAQLISGFSAQVREAPAGEAFSFVETKANVTEVARDKSGNGMLRLSTRTPRTPRDSWPAG